MEESFGITAFNWENIGLYCGKGKSFTASTAVKDCIFVVEKAK